MTVAEINQAASLKAQIQAMMLCAEDTDTWTDIAVLEAQYVELTGNQVWPFAD